MPPIIGTVYFILLHHFLVMMITAYPFHECSSTESYSRTGLSLKAWDDRLWS
ncbi:predicted protein [Sclerotinia sclerotiorum 1980 UF-70]|uniref:Uncharacterized protein n=1 Tax=Sclerotinia sclerotiorum (strain ATCC 18683 / 1980 / Ss-1) TaxID=665079 RepID=A7ET18_SCLS1|nr:predicted protein [Sclerotinia sclerotiorum 1980 UF-70]EDN92610.1 predicted protein [Sclerotinia sclerotiorum 1980 UF-70]